MENISKSEIDLLIKNGQIITETEQLFADLAISKGKVVGFFEREFPIHAKKIVDVQGKWILPGIIDVHTHFRHMGDHADDLEDVTRSAAFGGATSIISFISFDTRIPVDEGIKKFIDSKNDCCFTDFSFHLRLFPEIDFIKQIPKAIKLGINSFKVSLGYKKKGLSFSDELIFLTMERIRDNKGILMVHAENGAIIEVLENRLFREHPDNPLILAWSRPPFTEAESISRMRHLAMGTGCPIYIVHLSTALGLEEIKRAKDSGLEFFVETCPQYLLLNEQDLLAKRGLAKIGPPLRSSTDNQSLWEGVRNGLINTIGSDHVAYYESSKKDIISSPFGAPGVETLLNLVLSEGVLKKKVTIHRLVQILSTTPARIFGLYPKKGTIQPGSDADLVIIDPSIEYVIQARKQHSNSDYTLYEGWKVQGGPVMSFLRGEILLNGEMLEQKPGYGKFLARNP
jgi:dihydropyrimidinase